ncbi:MAG: hypothetical protein ACREOM_12840 [Candidatus Dormibacteraceae bacterium]
MRRRPLLGAVVLGCLTLSFLVARVIGWGPRGHQPGSLEVLLQFVVLLGACFLVASRVTGKR